MFIERPIPRAFAISRQCRHLLSHVPIASRIHGLRSYAAAAAATKTSTSSVPYTLSEIEGIKVASRDDGGATTGLSVVVKAGSRYCPFPGMAHMLEKFAWKVIDFPHDWQLFIVLIGNIQTDCIQSYKRSGVVGRTFDIKFISREFCYIRSISPRRYPLFPRSPF